MPTPDPVTVRAAPGIGPTKDEIRARVKAARAATTPAERRAADEARTGSLLTALGEWRPRVVAAYAHVDPEPGTRALLDAVAAWATVLLPVLSPTSGTPRRHPDWAVYEGADQVISGLWGIPEPSGPSLGQEALLGAELIILPGLAGTASGDRLGTGGGWYDRALVGSTAPRWLLLNDAEVFPSLPVEPWDLPVSLVVTEHRIIRCG